MNKTEKPTIQVEVKKLQKGWTYLQGERPIKITQIKNFFYLDRFGGYIGIWGYDTRFHNTHTCRTYWDYRLFGLNDKVTLIDYK